ncbi:MAG: DUF4147 domain-containing protein [Leucobacter sp.]
MFDPNEVFSALVSGLDSARLHQDYLESEEGARHVADASRVFVVAIGKCAQASAEGCAAHLGNRIESGITIDDLDRSEGLPDVFAHYRGDHPYALEQSTFAADRLIADIATWQLTPHDLVIVSVSGGTSSLIASPVTPLTVHELASVHERLLSSGLTVTTINSLRRQLSRLHDGGLLRQLSPARVLTLIQADNAQGSSLSVGSGPTMQEQNIDASAPLEHLLAVEPDLWTRVTEALRTKVPSSALPARHVGVVVLSDVPALARACRVLMESVGLDAVLLDSQSGAAWSTIVDRLVWAARTLEGTKPTALIVCGEATVEVPEHADGLGGRCQHVALALSEYVAHSPSSMAFTMASDGRDRIAGVRGAFVDHPTARAITSAMSIRSVLEAAGAHGALQSHDALLCGDRTRVNLCDAYILVINLPSGA